MLPVNRFFTVAEQFAQNRRKYATNSAGSALQPNPRNHRTSVRKASEARLDAWLGRILVADSIDDVFRNLG